LKKLPEMKKRNKKWNLVVLSPHLDDAVLSLGQHILKWKKEGKKVKIITIFTKFSEGKNLSGYSKDYLRKSGFNSVKEFGEARTREDKEAMKILRVDYEHWGFVDAGFRGIYKTREALLGGRVDKRDDSLEKQIEEKIKGVKVDLFMVPYGVGGHVDHVLLKKLSQKITNKYYYLESPYLWQNLNFLKLSWKIIRARSVVRGGEEKRRILRSYQSQYNLSMNDENIFTEVII